MLQFPPWKVILVLAIIVWGVLLALPNVVNMSGAPGWVPKKPVNLGLDLQGGVYLEMEIRPEEVIGGRLEVFARDVRTALARTDTLPPVHHLAEVRGRTMTIKLTGADAAGNFPIDDAIARINKYNGPLEGGIAGGRTYDVRRASADTLAVTVPANSENLMMADALTKTETIIRRRVDPDGVAEIALSRSGANRLVLEAPGEPDPQRLKDLLNRDGRMTFNIVDDSPSSIAAAEAGVVKPGYRLLSGPTTGPLLVRTIPEIVGSDIANASQGNDDANRPQINFRLNGNGARKFYETTRANTNKRFAIILDDVIMSAPNIQEPIPGGNVRITGDFSMTEAQDLAAIISAGEMPAKVQFLDQRVVSSTLGEDSIQAGYTAAIVGLLLVGGFMILAYGVQGMFAVVSLAVNIVLIFSCLAMFNATLTLPGIAGIVLTIGMAVDANVLVFERIREEQYAGRSIWTSVQAGYERAIVTIMDANITSLFSALVLYIMGTGPVKGFAVTLALGIITSVFTAVVLTRMLTVFWIKIAKPKRFNV